MKIPDNFSGSLEQFFGLKMLKLFDADLEPAPGIFSTLDPGWKIRILDIYPGSATLVIRC
jgi:hypothetical protein